MVSYGVAKARAMASKRNWNEEEYTSKAIITWADSEYEYELEIDNEDIRNRRKLSSGFSVNTLRVQAARKSAEGWNVTAF